jgi:hypothetical protein
MIQIRDANIENLRHMLGIGPHIKKRRWGYSNHSGLPWAWPESHYSDMEGCRHESRC